MEMCDDCVKLKTTGRSAPPHAHLDRLQSRRVGSIIGSADEIHYRCDSCGHEWLHETGNMGYGWIA